MTLPLDDVVEATGATVYELDRAPVEFNLVTDTRALRPGDAFLALRGDRFDGHAYVDEAIAKGAVALIIDDARARRKSVASFVVTDTLKAYMALGGAARRRFRGRVLAITGSAGKTTTKFLAAQCFGAAVRRSRPHFAREREQRDRREQAAAQCE